MHLDRVGQGTLMIKINDLFYPGKLLSSKKKMIVKMIFLTYYLYHLLFVKIFGQWKKSLIFIIPVPCSTQHQVPLEC